MINYALITRLQRKSYVPDHRVVHGVHCDGWHDLTILERGEVISIGAIITKEMDDRSRLQSTYQVFPAVTNWDSDTRLAKELAKLWNCDLLTHPSQVSSEVLVIVVNVNVTWRTILESIKEANTVKPVIALSAFDRSGRCPKEVQGMIQSGKLRYFTMANSPIGIHAPDTCPRCNPIRIEIPLDKPAQNEGVLALT